MNANTITIIIALVSGTVGAAGGASYVKFSSPVAEEIHDVAWFEAHTEERNAKVAECKGNPGELEWTPNCRNVQVAQGNLSLAASAAAARKLDAAAWAKLGFIPKKSEAQ